MINKRVELNRAYGVFHKKIGGWVDAKGKVRKYRFMFFNRQDFIDAGFNADLYSSMFIREGWMNTTGQLRQNRNVIMNGLRRQFDDNVAYKVMSVLRKSNAG